MPLATSRVSFDHHVHAVSGWIDFAAGNPPGVRIGSILPRSAMLTPRSRTQPMASAQCEAKRRWRTPTRSRAQVHLTRHKHLDTDDNYT